MVTNICSMQIPYSGVVLFVLYTILQIFFVNFFPHFDFKKVCTLIKHSVTKFPVISSFQYTLAFITSFFEGMFSQSRNFNENNMILWYYQIRPRVVWKVHGAWIDGYDSQNKDKTLPLRKLRVCYFFIQCIIAKPM